MKVSAIICCTCGPRGNHVSKVYFMVKKKRNAAKILQQNPTDLILLQCCYRTFLLQKLNFLQCLMGGPSAGSYIHAQHSTCVDEKCCSWPLGFRNRFWYQLKYFRSYTTFLLKFWHYETDLEHAVVIPLYQGYSLRRSIAAESFIVQKWGDPNL